MPDDESQEHATPEEAQYRRTLAQEQRAGATPPAAPSGPTAPPVEAAKQQLQRQGTRLVLRYATVPVLIALGVLLLVTLVVYFYYLLEDKCGWCVKVFHALPGT